ncbi:MAG: small basic protein [Candidatus Omnitrophica bacterium]|nr:small basic protein [Candidatus Omnitrophota bacterium]MDD5655003.1 small basic protein [Candidatus Omnitrophota bacterium]
MSMHPSLSSSSQDSKQGSVLKRSDRLKHMLEKGTWHPGDPVFGLPKIKSVKIKIKKEKAEKAAVEGAAPAAEGAAAPAPAAKAAAKPEKGAK